MTQLQICTALLSVSILLVAALVHSNVLAQTDIGEAVGFEHGDHVLAGSLLVPDGPAPYPVVVALQGSGSSSYQDSWSDAYFPFWKDIGEFLLQQGYAVLLYDKPGVHESTGDWSSQTFEDRADEAVAAIDYLASRNDMDANRIGLIGHSQGGWIAQIAGARHPEKVAFMIMLAGPSISVQQQILDDMASNWVCNGVSAAGLTFRSAVTKTGFDLLRVISRVAQPIYLSRIINFDPVTVLPEIQQPMLALFAQNDPLVLPESNHERLLQHFGTTHGNAHLSVFTVPEADHFFRTSPACPEGPRSMEWATGFFDALGDDAFWQHL